MDASPGPTAEMGKTGFRRLGDRLSASVPSPNAVLFGSAAWGILMTGSAMVAIWLQNGLLTATPLALAALYFYGGSLGFAPGLWLARLLLAGRNTAFRFLGSAVIMLVVTHMATAGIFALQYRVFYSHWHSNFPSAVWFFQLAFTSAGAIYQYSVASLYYYWPFGLLCVLGFGLWFARTNRPLTH